MELKFVEPRIENLEEITAVMERAFNDDAQRYLNIPKSGPPGYDNGEFYRKWLFEDSKSQGLLAIYENKVIGASIYWVSTNGESRLGNIFIDPEFQNRGIGKKFWREIENRNGNAKSWILDTPAYAIGNHHFYEKCGFVKTGECEDGCPGEVSFIFTKKII